VQGLLQKVLDEELQDVEVEIIKQSLNFCYKRCHLSKTLSLLELITVCF
jgi:hypothetical protein